MSPIPEPMVAGDLTQASFYGPAGCLDAGVLLGTMLPPLGGKRVGETEALRPQIGTHPMVGIILGGVYDPRQEASCRGGVEGLTIT